MNPALIALGALVTAVWWIAAVVAFHRKRWMLTAGSFGAGATAIVFTLTSSHVDVPEWLVTVAAVTRAPVAVFLVGSFLAHQPYRQAPRPDRWTP
jgi:hypothetical protein